MMYVLHLHWRPPTRPADTGEMVAWVENGTGRQPRKRKLAAAARPHPFSALPDALFDLLVAVRLIREGKTFPAQRAIYARLFGATPHKTIAGERLRAAEITLWLPTGAHGPQPSPQLQHGWTANVNDARRLAPWKIGGVGLSAADGFTLLANLPNADNLPAGFSLGSDVLYWQSVSDVALETLARQKILPILAQADSAGKIYHARWMPVLDAPGDETRLQQLQDAMPSLCRAAAENPAAAPHPRRLLNAFLNSAIDAQARLWGRAGWKPLTDDSVSAQWLNALFADSPVVHASPLQLNRFQKSHAVWLRNLYLSGGKNSRVAFRLQAPTQQNSRAKLWILHFALQARNDPSLLVDAAEVWQTTGSALQALGHRFDRPQETLLTGLGYAARLFPPLKPTLKRAKPRMLKLSTADAFDFLRNVAPLLEGSGFGVLVPPWWNKPGMRLGVRLKMSPAQSGAENVAAGRVSFEKLVNYNWELSLGETALSREEFAALAALKTPLAQIRGQWVHLNPDEIDAAIKFWQNQAENQASLFEAMQMGLGAETLHGIPVVDVTYEGWLKTWIRRLQGDEKLALLPVPRALQAQLRPYQEFGYSWLDFMRHWGMGACLADDMGLGKTIQTLTMLLREKEQNGRLPAPVLLICPTSVVINWGIEAHRFTPALRVMQHQGSNRLRGDDFVQTVQQHDLILSSYAIVRRDVETMRKIDWFGVVLDEAQNIKNPSAKQTQAIRSLKGQFRLALTGTPVENRLSELWSIMQFLNPGFLGTQKAFRAAFAKPIERYQDEDAAAKLRKITSPFILRRMKTDPAVIRDLPEKNEMKVYCNLSEEQATLYEAVVQTSINAINETTDDGIERKGLVLGMLMKLKQICNHPAQFLHQVGAGQMTDPALEMRRSGKLARLTQMLEETLAVGDHSLVFTQFTEMGKLLQAYLPQKLGAPVIFLHGGVAAKKRAEMVRRFQEDPNGPPIFLLSLKAGGSGLNLTRANHVFHFDRWWNPAVEDQATDRAFRIGQRKNVQVHKFIVAGTLEEMIDEMIESKKALADTIVGKGEGWLTELSTADLRQLVALRKETFE